MKRQLFAGLAAVVAATASLLFASSASAAAPDPTTAAAAARIGVTPNGDLPLDIRVEPEADYKIVASLIGVGKQIYDCTAGGTYAFREPAAGLFTSRGIPAAIHGKGPFWTSFDGSHVNGSGAVSVPAQPPVTPAKNVPWLRLVGSQSPDNVNPTTGVFSNVAFIQRIDTRGGVAPAGSCTAPRTVAVDYTANYVFWAHK